MAKLEKTELMQRVDEIGKDLSLTHTINKDFLCAFHKAERRVEYAWIYNLVYYSIRKWNRFLNKLKIEVK
jgi:hypothetical protein